MISISGTVVRASAGAIPSMRAARWALRRAPAR